LLHSALTFGKQKQDDAEGKGDKLCDLAQQSLQRYAFLDQRLAALELHDGALGYEPTSSALFEATHGSTQD